MARFDVYRYSQTVPFVVDVQADILRELRTRVVLPLLPLTQANEEKTGRLKPTLRIEGTDYVLLTTDIGVVIASALGERVANIEDQYRGEITAALDFLFQGF